MSEKFERPKHQVTDGPTREDIFDALRLRGRNQPGAPRLTPRFTFIGAYCNYDKAEAAEMMIFGVYHLGGDKWLICAGMLGSGSDFLFEYDVESRAGWVWNMGDGHWRKHPPQELLLARIASK